MLLAILRHPTNSMRHSVCRADDTDIFPVNENDTLATTIRAADQSDQLCSPRANKAKLSGIANRLACHNK